MIAPGHFHVELPRIFDRIGFIAGHMLPGHTELEVGFGFYAISIGRLKGRWYACKSWD